MLVKSSISWHFQSVATCLSGKNRYVAHLIDDLKFCDVAVGIWPVQKGLPELMNLIGSFCLLRANCLVLGEKQLYM